MLHTKPTPERQIEPRSSHNTNGMRGDALARQERDFKNQEAAVLNLLTEATRPHPVSRIHDELIKRGMIGSNTPIQSIRRAVSNLVKRRLVEKLPRTVIGPYEKPEFLHQLRH